MSRAVDAAVLRFAARQHGVITTTQLTELGVGRNAVTRHAEAGQLHRVRRGVYAVGRRDLSPNGHRLAAVLACGPGGRSRPPQCRRVARPRRWRVATSRRARPQGRAAALRHPRPPHDDASAHGVGFHLNRGAFEDDRVRDAAMQRSGNRVLRITDKRLSRQPARVLDDILTLARRAD